MTRPLILSLLCVLLLSACGGIQPQGVLSPSRQTQMAQNAQKAQGTPVLAPTGESPLLIGERATNTQKPRQTATPNEAGTLAVMALQATERSYSDNKVLIALTVTMQARIDNYVIQTQTAQPPAQTATMAAQETQSAALMIQSTARIESWTATAAAPAMAATAVFMDERKKAAWFSVWADPVGMLLLGIGVIWMGVGIYLFSRKPRINEAPGYEPIEREDWQADGTPQYPARVLIVIPENIATDKQLRIVADKLKKGLALTHANFTPTIPNGFSEGQFTKFCEYLLYNHPPLAVRAKNNGIEPLPSLRRFLRNKVDRPAPPAPDVAADTSVQPVDRQTDAPTDAQSGAGEMFDPHNILPKDGER